MAKFFSLTLIVAVLVSAMVAQSDGKHHHGRPSDDTDKPVGGVGGDSPGNVGPVAAHKKGRPNSNDDGAGGVGGDLTSAVDDALDIAGNVLNNVGLGVFKDGHKGVPKGGHKGGGGGLLGGILSN